MQVQEEIGEHHDDPIPPVERHRVTEDALPDLGVADGFADGHEGVLSPFSRYPTSECTVRFKAC
jgi:hypothetical protein